MALKRPRQGRFRLSKDKHCRSLVYVTEILFAVGAEPDGRYVREDFAVGIGEVVLLQFQGPKDAVEIDYAGYLSPGTVLGLDCRTGISHYVGRSKQGQLGALENVAVEDHLPVFDL